jgi:hypothetical protein
MEPQYQHALIQALMNGNGGNKPTPDQVNTAANPMMNQFIAGAPADPNMAHGRSPPQPGMSPFSPQPMQQTAGIGRGY